MRLRTLRLDRIGRLSAPLVAAALLLGSASLAPAQTERLPKVGYLGFGASVPPTHFQNRMRELRYSEGKEVTVEYRFAGGRPGELPRLAAICARSEFSPFDHPRRTSQGEVDGLACGNPRLTLLLIAKVPGGPNVPHDCACFCRARQ